MASDKARIMLIVPMLHQGGFERICAMTAQLLKETQDVHLVVFNTEDMIYDVSGVHLIDLELGAVPGTVHKLFNICRRVKQVRRLKKELGIEISYSFGQTANIVNVLSAYKDKTWVGIRGYGALAERREMRFVCKRAQRVVSCTKVMEQDISRSYSVKSHAVLYNPCNLEEIRSLSRQKTDPAFAAFLERPGKTVVSMGREDDVKGFWHLIKCAALVKKSVPDTKLMIIGEGDYTEYKELAKKLHIEEDVLFTGVQKNPFALLARADVYALTSDSEGFPNALIEAMALGLPAISANCKTGPAEILQEDYCDCTNADILYRGDYGILTPVFRGEKNMDANHVSREEALFAEELKKLLTNENGLWEQYHKKALQRASDFGTEVYQRELEALIQKDSGNAEKRQVWNTK